MRKVLIILSLSGLLGVLFVPMTTSVVQAAECSIGCDAPVSADCQCSGWGLKAGVHYCWNEQYFTDQGQCLIEKAEVESQLDSASASCVSKIPDSGWCILGNKCTENYLRENLIDHYCGTMSQSSKDVVVDFFRRAGGLLAPASSAVAPTSPDGGGQAQTSPSGATKILGLPNPLGEGTTFETLLNKIIDFIFWIGMAVAPVMIIVAGFLYVTSTGNPQKVEQAKKIIIYAVVGLVVLLIARGLVKVIESIIGV